MDLIFGSSLQSGDRQGASVGRSKETTNTGKLCDWVFQQSHVLHWWFGQYGEKFDLLIKEIEAATHSNLEQLSARFQTQSNEIKAEINYGDSLIKQRDALHAGANEILEKAQKADKIFKAHKMEKESYDIQMNISYIYSLLYRIVNVRSLDEFPVINSQYTELHDKLTKQIELANKLV